MIKIDILLEKIKNNDLDINDGLNTYSDDYLNSCIEIQELGNISHIPYIMETLIDWYYNEMIAYHVGDLIVGYYHIDSVGTVKIFLSNIDKMYPHAKRTLEYILSEFLGRSACKEHIYSTFQELNLQQKKIFKEVYLNTLSEYPRLAIPEIDEALKSIG